MFWNVFRLCQVCHFLGHVSLWVQRPIVVKLSREQSVGRSLGLLVGWSVCLSSALWKNSRSDLDAIWHHRSGGSRDKAGSGVCGSVHGKGDFWGTPLYPMGILRHTCTTVTQPSELLFAVVRAVGRGTAMLDGGQRSPMGRGVWGFFVLHFHNGKCHCVTAGVSDSYAKISQYFRSANLSLESSILGLLGDIFSFKIKLGFYEKLAKT